MNAMNGFPLFDKELDTSRMGNGHANPFGDAAFSPPSANPYPDFALPLSNQFGNGMEMRHQMSSSPNSMGHGNQWPNMLPPQQQQQRQMQPQMGGHMGGLPQQFNQQWNQGMPAQQFPHGMRNMNMGMNNGMPFIPPHMMNDALGINKQEEGLLIHTLIQAQTKRISYREALNSLHGNGHAALEWKDHYLEHKYRLDSEIAAHFNQSLRASAVKKPMMGLPRMEPSISPVASSSAPAPPLPSVRNQPKSRSRKSSTPLTQPASPPPPASASRASSASRAPPAPSTSRRSTINSLTTHTAVFNRNLPPPHTDLKIPEVPSRSPTPPTRIVPQGRGNRFTDEDKVFFLKFISRRLNEDSSLTRHDLLQLLAEKAPHHSPMSWGSYWSNNHDLPDKIVAAAKGLLAEDDDESEEETIRKSRPRPKYKDMSSGEEDEEEEAKPVRRSRARPKYKAPSSDEDEDDKQDDDDDDEDAKPTEDEDAEADDDDEEEEYRDDEEDDGSPLPEFDETAMGSKGGPFTEADHAIAARYIATFPAFVTSQDKWVQFSAQYPERSGKSWAEYYRRNEKTLQQMAAKIRKRNPPSKRKFEADDEDEDGDGSKHRKVSES